jgi:hypothetical protein
MSFWKEIKYALNSSLGTPSFKPLDIIVKESGKNGKKLIAPSDPQDNIYYYCWFEDRVSNGEEKFFEKQFKMKASGGCKIWASGKGTFKVYKNGNLYKSEVLKSPTTVDILVDFAENDVISISYLASLRPGIGGVYISARQSIISEKLFEETI